MRAWPAPDLPALPGDGAAGARARHRRRARSSRPLRPAPARMYVCGITPYDATHLGHAATYVAFDLLNRAWRDAGHDVDYVQNVTDVDDPLLERADAGRRSTGATSPSARPSCSGRTWTALRVLPPTRLRRRGRGDPGDRRRWSSGCQDAGVPYDRRRTTLLLGRGRPGFGAGSRLDPRADARALRRARRRPRPARQEGPARLPALAGRAAGRAGLGRARSARAGPAGTSSARRSRWTTSAMTFDVQGGGTDLVFPHHEMCAVQAQVLTGDGRSPGPTCTPGWSGSTARRCRSRKGNLVFVSALRAQRRRPDGDPAGAAAPPLPQRLGVDRRRALGRPSTGSTAGAAAGARRRRRRGAGRRRRARPRSPTTSTPRAAVAAVEAWADATLGTHGLAETGDPDAAAASARPRRRARARALTLSRHCGSAVFDRCADCGSRPVRAARRVSRPRCGA